MPGEARGRQRVGDGVVPLRVVAVVRPHMRVLMLGSDLIHRLQVLVGPHVAATWRGPRGGQRVERDALGLVEVRDTPKRAKHDRM